MSPLRRHLPVISATVVLLAGLGWGGIRWIPLWSKPASSGSFSSTSADRNLARTRRSSQDARTAEILNQCLEILRSGKDADPSFTDSLSDLSATQYRQLILAILDFDGADFAAKMKLVDWFLLMDSSSHPAESLSMLDAIAPYLRNDGKLPDYHVAMMVGYAAEGDPKFAVDWLREHASKIDPKPFEDALQSLLTHAAGAQPAGALALLVTLPEDQRVLAIAAIGRGVRDSERRSDVWAAMQTQSASMSPEDAEVFRSAALEGIADGLTGVHRTKDGVSIEDDAKFGDAIQWVESAGLSQQELGTVAAHLEATRDSVSDGQWMDWLSANVPSGISPMMSTWAASSPAEAEQWLTNNANSPGAPAAIEAFLVSLGDRDPEASARAFALLPQDQQDAMGEQITQELSEKKAADQHGREAAAERAHDFLEGGENASAEAQAAKKSRQR